MELLRRISALLHWRQRRQDLDAEMALHRDLLGNNRRFGNELRLRERGLAQWGWGWLETFAQDVRHGLRLLVRTPVATALALVSLTLGIGANVALFSLTDAVLLRPLPVTHAENLAEISATLPGGVGEWPALTNPLWEQLRDHPGAMQTEFAWSRSGFNLGNDSDPELQPGIYVSGDYFSGLGVAAERGRVIATGDDYPNCPAIADISDGFWHSHFGAAPNVVGQSLWISGTPFTVVGVTPSWFFGAEVGDRFDIAVPLCTHPMASPQQGDMLHSNASWWLTAMGRLHPGESTAEAGARLMALKPQWQQVLPGPPYLEAKEKQDFQLSVAPATHGETSLTSVSGYGAPLQALLAVSLLVLLVACANLAGLMLARAAARRPEVTVRLALGASRRRLVRQLLTESQLLAAGGAGLGLGFAVWACAALERFFSYPGAPMSLNLAPDVRMVGFTVGVTVATALLIGLIPALRATRVELATAPRPQRGATPAAGRWIAAAQLALALVLVTGAGLFVRSFRLLVGPGKGFDTQDILLVTALAPRGGTLPSDASDALAQLRSLPGVNDTSGSVMTPAQGSLWNGGQLEILGRAGAVTTADNPFFNAVEPGYFATLRTPLLRGRDFTSADTPQSPTVAIVNRAMARQIAPAGDAIGATVRAVDPMGKAGTPLRIIGIVADAKYNQLDSAAPPTIYLAVSQQPHPARVLTYYVRSQQPAATLAREVRATMQALAPGARLTIESYDAMLADAVKPQRLLATLSEVFGGLALLLAAIGLFGILAYNAGRRRREFGIRVALGASSASISRLVLSDMAVILGTGAVAGIGLSWVVATAGTASLGKLLYGVRPVDPATLAAATALLLLVGVAAAWLPARRAASADPLPALREE